MAQETSGREKPGAANRRLALRLLLATLLAFAFAFALVPFYDVFCRLTGINGKSANLPVAAPPAPRDLSRSIRVEFTGTAMPGLGWEITPVDSRIQLHPGEVGHTRFRVSNTTDQPITGQAVSSISPGQAAAHFNKLECFCFRQQTLAPGESKELPLSFIIAPSLGRDVHTLTLAYAFFKAGAAPPP